MSFFDKALSYGHTSPLGSTQEFNKKDVILVDTSSQLTVSSGGNGMTRHSVGKQVLNPDSFSARFENSERIQGKLKSILKQKLTWVCLLLTVFAFRGLFMRGGWIDYQKLKSNQAHVVQLQESLRLENLQIQKEIEELKNNKLYQKKVVRDQLGVIGANEYIIVFEEKT